MLLKSLELHGFKSFPDKITLNFGKGITAVVGPNGSGKSNISDAICWVLGEQSARQLRGEKMEDVVFSGTEKRKGKGFAEVSLTVDNSDRRLAYDSDDIKITRRYFRSGESEYLINGNNVRLKDIHELLMDTGLGRDGYSVIGQGKIGDIVASRSEDRREIFEEAAGISKYRYRKNEAERRLNQAQDNLLRLKDILSELESRIGPLQEQSKKAQEFLEYSAQKKSLEIGIWLNTLQKSKNCLKEQDEKIAAARQQYERSGDEINKIDSEIEDIYTKMQQYSMQIDELRRSASALEEEATRADGTADVLQNDIHHNKETIARIEAEIEQGSFSEKDIDREISAKEQEILKKREYIDGQQKQLDSQIELLTGLHEENQQFSDEIEQGTSKLNALSLEIANTRVAAVTAASSIAEISSRIEAIDKSLEAKREQAQGLEKELIECDKILGECNENINSLENTVKGFEFKLNARRQKVEELQKLSDKLMLDIEQRKRRAQLLQELERNLEGFAHSVKTVMQEAKRGMLKGIHGPVSGLISVPEKYSTAIETALGSSMQNIVVDDESSAKQAIELLKRQNSGRATFLPLTTIKARRLSADGVESCKGFIGISSNLVEYAPVYSDIIQYVLGTTVVADNLDNAVDIAKKFGYRFRVVTLDGQVVNAGGSLTGGSGSKNAGLLGRRAEIKRMHLEAEKLSKEAQEVSRDLKRAKEQLSAINAELIGAQAELTTNQEDRIRLKAEKLSLTQQLDSTRSALAELENERAAAAARIKELEKEKQSNEEKIADLDRQAKEIEDELSKLSNKRLELSQKRQQLSGEIEQLRFSILSANKDIESMQSYISDLGARKSGQAERIERLKSEKNELIAKNDEITRKIEQIRDKANQMRQSAEQAAVEIEQLNALKLKSEGASSELRRQSREKSIEHEKIGRELARLEERKVNFQKEYDEIVAKLWDEYQLTRSEAEKIGEKIENINKAKRSLNAVKQKIRDLGSVNVAAIEEYKEVSQRYEFMKEQINDAEKSREELIKLISDLTTQMSNTFVDKFKKINQYFGQIFTELFGGGKARLFLTKPDDVLNSGIEIEVQPPGKIINHLSSLSGGEKALVAISIYFAILRVNPSPFCVLDEIEAQLDEINIDRFSAFMRRMSDEIQFIVITHRRSTMENADVLYGVTMQEKGVSKLLELRLSEVGKELGV